MPRGRKTGTELAKKVRGGAGVGAGALGELPEEQRRVLEMLLGGSSMVKTARAAGISRMTVYRWLREDPVFQAAYNQWHEQMQESCRSRLLMMTEKAASAVEKALEAGDARLGMQMLRELGLMKQPEVKRMDAEVVARVSTIKKRRQMAAIVREEEKVGMEELLAQSGMKAGIGGVETEEETREVR